MRLSSRVSRAALGAAVSATLMAGLPWLHADAAQPRVVIAGTTPLPTGSVVVSGAHDTTFDLVLTSKDPGGAAQFVRDVSDPTSANYRHFLTPTAYAARFGAAADTIAAVSSFLRQNGLTAHTVSRGGVLIHVTGTTHQVAHAFATSLETIRQSNGVLATALTSAATVPAALAHDVVAAVGLTPVVPRTSNLVAHATTPSTLKSCPNAGVATGATPNANGYNIQQQGNAYGFTPLWHNGLTGKGAVIALYELGVSDTADTNVFFRCYGLTPTVSTIKVDGGATGAFTDEATMDVEQAAALAPGATIAIYSGPNTGSAPVDVYARIADDDTATVVSTSWGDCELDPSGSIQAEQPLFEQMAAEGITVVAAAGDSGSSDCNGITSNAPAVDDPASQPFVTGVGGLSVSSIAPLHATVWNSGGGASGGGVSTQWSRPWWQQGAAFASDTAQGVRAAAGRMVPDLAVMGDPATGFVQYFTGNDTATVICKGQNCKGGWGGVGGTSIGAPLVSALVAVAAQSCGLPRLGFLNPLLYASPAEFSDVTTGTNDLFQQHVFSAGTGYDLASGLGTPTSSLITALCPPTPSALTSTVAPTSLPAIVGIPTPLTVTVRSASGLPLINTPVTFATSGTAPSPQLDGQPTSSTTPGVTTLTVNTSSTGTATVTLTAAGAGTSTVTETAGGVALATQTITVVTLASLQVPPHRSTITAIAGTHSARITVNVPPAYYAPLSYDASFNSGKTRTTFAATSSTLTLRGMKPGRGYDLIVRVRNAYGVSPWSSPFHIRTLG